MSDPSPKPPNLSIPAKPLSDVIHSKKSGNSLVSKSSHRRFKKKSKKSNNKVKLGMSLGAKGNEEDEVEDMEVKEAVCEDGQNGKGKLVLRLSNNVNEDGGSSVKNTNDNGNNSGKNVNYKGWDSAKVEGIQSYDGQNNDAVNNSDVEMNDKASPKKPMSFASVVPGLSSYGNNKLRYIPVSVNEKGLRITASMCENAYGRANFARVLVKVDASNDLVDSIEVCYRSLGKSMMLDVEYAWVPPMCSHCKVFGHSFEKCGNRIITQEEVMKRNENKNVTEKGATKVMGDSNNNVSQNNIETSYGRGGYNGRGGYYGRGRGVMSGRGGYSSVGPSGTAKNVGVQEDPAKENLTKKAAIKDEENINLWQEMKMTIDLSFDLGIPCSEDEINLWSKDVYDYYKQKCAALEKSKKNTLCREKLKVLEDRIVEANRNINQVVMAKAKSLVDSKMKAEKLNREQALTTLFLRVHFL
ncbi:zinc knuckle CX2CX4HX4C [Artemisia annua]|uniref:Zinc knuckle CX2CX4HX4C n=1 Tax=Artemisia annua TaxID=35608 RepID=A0A2U1PZ49_ARTAN|nr:zinc knuckle CX2CX4HX4C [Artemisia annua]